MLAAMTDSGIDTSLMTARGYGESLPIADNETEEGREANRRIEFKLLAEEPVQDSPSAAPAMVSGVTSDLPAPELVGPVLPADGPSAADAAANTPEGAPEAAQDPQAAPVAQGADVPDELRDYAEMMSTILVTELVQMGHVDGSGLTFDGEQEQAGEGEAAPDDETAPEAAADAATAAPAAPEDGAQDGTQDGTQEGAANAPARAEPQAAQAGGAAPAAAGATGPQAPLTRVSGPDPVTATEAVLAPLVPETAIAGASSETASDIPAATPSAETTPASGTSDPLFANVFDPLDLTALTAQGLPDWTRIRAAMGIAPLVGVGHSVNPAQSASTAGLAPLQDRAADYPVQTPDETTPRPQPRPATAP
ncbi:hypothetical protein [Paracoccus cavernae]|uniref:hypothetical protein n=1 Tax=Paracoccus cavernae TaxID=1571207 RepID=UPI00362D3A8B